ncbi:hypothetical protein OXPF_42150 [Oxobacter pfennigii]|uniref:Uncharacterized protein n=1 Tax=Oxobacter pfennigii TaxID=36849 RepID=A0A0P8WJT8_9CLOT|nr:hypothetical protein [Oxobacter pfennigii]KPU42430.1 hypothetical protein OXPF_42150 [Oxobacter pfennigii]
MSDKKNFYDYMKTLRRSWEINPRTRVQENDLNNKKKRRQQEKKIIKDGFE